jgi:diphthamide synthase (EF-2-diphthine--ammonia ligase)
LQGIYPLWQLDTGAMISEFIRCGFKTLICAANAKYFPATQMGKTIDDAFVRQLPAEVDPCGENGEFHTFVYDGPVFKRQVAYETGAVVSKTYTYQKTGDTGTSEKIETTFLFQELLS